MQKKGLRIEAGCGYLSHTEPICKQMQLLKVADMFRVAPGAPNSAKFRGGCKGPSKIRQRGGCNNFLIFTR